MIQMNNLLRKKLNKRGFTLAELLVVVAIIAVLVAISIPIFTAQLDKAKTATDQANLRAAKAAAVVEFLSGDGDAVTDKFYDAESGKLVDALTDITEGYAQGSNVKDTSATPEVSEKDDVIQVEVSTAGAVTLTWVDLT
ncbi:MAG: prepilin-type N-terminal cleavage/methylation domain-containing protein [Eubacteriales bacterium]|nr:prepilin-type N-terminal cleavage/methylation domain-containing protein [Eubacteriales bacterium]